MKIQPYLRGRGQHHATRVVGCPTAHTFEGEAQALRTFSALHFVVDRRRQLRAAIKIPELAEHKRLLLAELANAASFPGS